MYKLIRRVSSSFNTLSLGEKAGERVMLPFNGNKSLLNLPKVIGHRGACHYAPENTLASFRTAYALGTSWVECDVMLTADEEPILIHDLTLDRTTNGHGKVAKTSSAEIAKLDAGLWFGPKFIGEKIPRLIDFLQLADALHLGINIEIKPTSGYEDITADTVIKLLDKHWPDKQRLLISSFSIPSLKRVRSLNPDVSLGLLLDRWEANWQKVLEELNCIALHAEYKLLTPDKVAKITASGRYVLAYTVDDSNIATKLYSWGVDAVFSNVPDKITLRDGPSRASSGRTEGA
jgi:glycerophosphoryl diester phosphodiesterase